MLARHDKYRRSTKNLSCQSEAHADGLVLLAKIFGFYLVTLGEIQIINILIYSISTALWMIT